MNEKKLQDPVLLGVPIIEDGTAHIEPYIPCLRPWIRGRGLRPESRYTGRLDAVAW
mgnify:CR=1 FL=1